MRYSIPSGCERCGEKTNLTFGSYFDESVICERCIQLEREHPDYQRAHDTEVKQVQAGNYNYPGVGLPDDLLEQCQRARHDAQAERESAQTPLPTS